MCGIFCSLRTTYKQENISADEDAFRIISDKLKRANAARGPDARHATSIGFPTRSAACSSSEIPTGHILEFYASELRLRGVAPIVQPHMGSGDVLCWNGEVFEGLEIGPAENDGQKVFERFQLATEALSIQTIIGNIEGP
jgi:asparagine synthetase B (glutamine-hydrolysing)